RLYVHEYNKLLDWYLKIGQDTFRSKDGVIPYLITPTKAGDVRREAIWKWNYSIQNDDDYQVVYTVSDK
ncbi:MAG: hypothetical protein GY810_21205, partial [Aureispira sp.]|nr:hypothetical protein [Aureispira sp.]